MSTNDAGQFQLYMGTVHAILPDGRVSIVIPGVTGGEAVLFPRLDNPPEVGASTTIAVSSDRTNFYWPDYRSYVVNDELVFVSDGIGASVNLVQAAADNALVAAQAAQDAADLAQAAADGKIVTFLQPDQPVDPGEGDLWIDTDDGNSLHRWNGTVWQSAQDAGIDAATAAAIAAQTAADNAQATADGKIVTFYQAAAPTGQTIGDLWVETDAGNKLWRWNGSSWQSVQDTSIAAANAAALAAQNAANAAQADADQALADAADAAAIADGKVTTFFQAAAPTADGVGDLWIDTDDSNKLYRWNGTVWQSAQDAGISAAQAAAIAAQTAATNAQATADSKIKTFYQAAQPASGMSVGDLWVDTDDGNRLYRYSGSAWQNVRDTTIATAQAAATAAQAAAVAAQADADQALVDAADAQATADGKVYTYFQTTAPTGLVATDVGDLWIDTDDSNKLYRWSGSAWQTAQDAGIPAAISAAAAAQTTANTKIKTYYQTAQPASGMTTGDLWVDTDDGNKLYRYSGSAWQNVQDAAIAAAAAAAQAAQTAAIAAQADADQALIDAQDAQATADGKVYTYFQAAAPTGLVAADVGDLWFETDANNKLWRWSGSAWVDAQDAGISAATAAAAAAQTTANSKIKTYYQTAQPASGMTTGDLWVDTDDGNKLWRYSGSAWVNVQDSAIAAANAAALAAQADADQALADAFAAQDTADGKATTFVQATAPTAEGTGDLWIDSDDGNKLYRWSGSAWVAVQDAAIIAAANAAAAAQTTANTKIVTYYQTTAPATGLVAGDLWIDTDDGRKLWRWSGSAWVDVHDAAIDAAAAAAAAAQSTANTANTTANSALTIANGKNKSYYQPTAPATGLVAGDLWFDDDAGYKPYRWSGSAWQPVADTMIVGSQVVAGTLTGDKIAANTITAGKLAVVPTTANMVLNGGFEDPDMSMWPASGTGVTGTRSAAQQKSGLYSAAIAIAGGNIGGAITSSRISVTPLTELVVGAWFNYIAAGVTPGVHYFRVFKWTATGAAATPAYTDLVANVSNSTIAGVWTLKEFAYTPPADTYQISIAIYNYSNSTGTLHVDDVSVRPRVKTIELADGVITGDKVNAATTINVGTDTNKIILTGTAAASTTIIKSGSTTYGGGTGFYIDASGRFSLGTQLTYNGAGVLTIGGYATDSELTTGLAGKLNVGGAEADITTISGGKITTGTLDGNKINAASTITVGSDPATKITLEGTSAASSTIIRSGTTGYGTGTGFYVDATGKFSLGTKLTYNGAGVLTIVGDVAADLFTLNTSAGPDIFLDEWTDGFDGQPYAGLTMGTTVGSVGFRLNPVSNQGIRMSSRNDNNGTVNAFATVSALGETAQMYARSPLGGSNRVAVSPGGVTIGAAAVNNVIYLNDDGLLIPDNTRFRVGSSGIQLGEWTGTTGPKITNSNDSLTGYLTVSGGSGMLVQGPLWVNTGGNSTVSLGSTGLVSILGNSTPSLVITNAGGWIYVDTSSGIRFRNQADSATWAQIDSGGLEITGTRTLAFSTYGGGLYMADSTWLRVTGSKSFFVDAEIRGAGNVVSQGAAACGAGTTTPEGSSARVFSQKHQDAQAWSLSHFMLRSAGTVNRQVSIAFHAENVAPILCATGTGEQLHVRNNPNTGYAPIAASAFNIGSSLRFKQNVVDLDDNDVLTKVKTIRPIRFRNKLRPQNLRPTERFKDTDARWQAKGKAPLNPGSNHVESHDHDCAVDNCFGTPENPCSVTLNDTERLGVSAEQLYTVVPEAVNVDAEGVPETVDISQIAALALAGVGALTRRIEELESRIAA